MRSHGMLAAMIVASLMGAACAEERITAFVGDIVVAADGLMTVTETISVLAEGQKIKRGIYRDLPTRYPDGPLGLGTRVPLAITAIELDGDPVAFHTENQADFLRIYIGEQQSSLPAGPHTYTVTYTTRQLRFFRGHDELYWNVTGHAWAFPIDRVEATVTLPGEVPLDQVHPEGYVGSLGSKNQQDLTAAVDLDRGRVVYRTVRALAAGEGLTIVARFPKGFVREPSTMGRLLDDPFFRWGSGGLLLVVGYFSVAWWLVGRDPPTGVILPLYEPPDGLSPAACRSIVRMGYDDGCFAAAILSLASKGVITIREHKGRYTLDKASGLTGTASVGEQKVFQYLLGDRDSLAVEQQHHDRFSEAINGLRTGLAREFEGTLFRPNREWFWGGVALAVVTVLLVVFVGGGAAVKGERGFLMLWLALWSIGVVAMLHQVLVAWRTVALGGPTSRRMANIGSAVLLTIFAVPFVGAEIGAFFYLATQTSLWLLPLLLGIVSTVGLFHEWIKAPTAAGRAIMDRIDGFRMYLATAEGDQLETHTRLALSRAVGGPLTRTLDLFERFLPYAVALGVANQWARQFRDLIEAASVPSGSHEGAGYHPAWYHGDTWSAATPGISAAGLGAAMTSAVVAAATSPSSGSSGSGGGGSSGGGGGGGGGGGW
jgi:uncharacterized membrane protein YgcG